MADDPEKSPLRPTALALRDAARLLSRVGGRPISVEMIEADIADGAPTNADGTINLVHYTAWLMKEIMRSNNAS